MHSCVCFSVAERKKRKKIESREREKERKYKIFTDRLVHARTHVGAFRQSI